MRKPISYPHYGITQCNTLGIKSWKHTQTSCRKNIHDLRVSFKNWKSVTSCSTIPEEDIEGFTDTRQFFRITGKYHDTAMSLSLINRIWKKRWFLPAFSDYLKKHVPSQKFAVKKVLYCLLKFHSDK